MSPRTATIIGGIGRTLITLGVLVIAFAGFQLYGTGILEAQAQSELESDFEERLDALVAAGLITETVGEEAADPIEAVDATTTTTEPGDPDDPGVDTEADPTEAAAPDSNAGPLDAATDAAGGVDFVARPGAGFTVSDIEPTRLTPEQIALLTPGEGEVLGRIDIPAIDLERSIVEGVRRDDLRKGPGHYPDTPLPGQPGNAAIAGHRTTYGQPFHDLDRLDPGDLIRVTTTQGEHFYEVMGHTDDDGNEVGHFIVRPDQTEVLDDAGDNRLTLTACHPKRSSRLRIIVTARLVSEPTAVLPELSPEQRAELDLLPDEPIDELAIDVDNGVGIDENELEDSLGWNWEERTPTVLWGLAAAAAAVVGLVVGRLWRKWPAYALAAPPTLILLFFCFVHLDRMLPAL